MAQAHFLVSFPSQASHLPYLHSFLGLEYTDTVTIVSGLVISGQSIGVASASEGFRGVDGILG